jgi:DNA-binding transcriptional LysR family regulator
MNATPSEAAGRIVPAVMEQLKALRCVAAVARHGSTIAAAAALHMSQPAVTRAVLELERRLQVRLFDRAARGMLATAAGTRAAQRARVLFEHLCKGAQEAAATMPERQRRGGSAERFAAVVAPASLKALLAVAPAASEAGAARALGISQPAVHRALRALEHLCGATLFQKSARGTRLSEAGDALLRRVKLAAAEARALEGDIAAWRGQLRGRIVVGALPLSVALVLPQAADAVLRSHPEVEIAIVDGTYESLLQQLRSADVDLIVGALRADDGTAEVRQELLFEDDLAVVARAGHPCLQDSLGGLAGLMRFDWVVPLEGTPASAALARLFAAQGLAAPPGAIRASSPAMTRALVLQTGRLALASRGQALEEDREGRIGGLKLVPVPLPGTQRAIGLIVRSEGEPAPDLRVLIEALHAAARQATG